MLPETQQTKLEMRIKLKPARHQYEPSTQITQAKTEFRIPSPRRKFRNDLLSRRLYTERVAEAAEGSIKWYVVMRVQVRKQIRERRKQDGRWPKASITVSTAPSNVVCSTRRI